MDPRMFAPVDVVGSYAKGLQVRQHREQAEEKKRLADLLPGAVRGEQGAIDEIAGINPELFMRLDDRQKAQAKEELADLTAAVRWADNPEKWQHVQRHFGAKGVDLSAYDFGQREQGMLALGKLGEYLESAPKPEYRAIEPGGSLIDVTGGNPRVVIAPNDGSAQMGAPAQGGVQEGATATNPQTGEKIIFRNGQWIPMGGAGSNAGGNFPPSGY